MMNYSHAHQSPSQANFDEQRQETEMRECSPREEQSQLIGSHTEYSQNHPLQFEQLKSGSDLKSIDEKGV